MVDVETLYDEKTTQKKLLWPITYCGSLYIFRFVCHGFYGHGVQFQFNNCLDIQREGRLCLEICHDHVGLLNLIEFFMGKKLQKNPKFTVKKVPLVNLKLKDWIHVLNRNLLHLIKWFVFFKEN